MWLGYLLIASLWLREAFVLSIFNLPLDDALAVVTDLTNVHAVQPKIRKELFISRNSVEKVHLHFCSGRIIMQIVLERSSVLMPLSSRFHVSVSSLPRTHLLSTGKYLHLI